MRRAVGTVGRRQFVRRREIMELGTMFLRLEMFILLKLSIFLWEPLFKLPVQCLSRAHILKTTGLVVLMVMLLLLPGLHMPTLINQETMLRLKFGLKRKIRH